jgi:hypothetical protein
MFFAFLIKKKEFKNFDGDLINVSFKVGLSQKGRRGIL